MWWRRKPVQVSEKTQDQPSTVERRIDDLEAGFRRLKGEWLDHVDRLDRLAGRISKRLARERAAEEESPANGTVHEPETPTDVVQLRRSGGHFPGRRE